MRATKLYVVVAVCAALLCAVPRQVFGQTNGRMIGGVTGNGTAECELNASLGARVARTGYEWREIQPTPAPIDWNTGNAAAQDASFECFRTHGIRIFYTLAYAPAWAGGGGDGHQLPNFNAWQEFVRQTIAHYAYLGDGIVFGIWNEPDGRFLNGCPGQLDKGECWGYYLWSFATAARDAANPSAILAGPDMGTLDSRLDSALSWMRSYARPQDIVTTHWYNHGDSQDWWVQTVTNKAGGRTTWLTETGVNRCEDGLQASEVNTYASQFVFSSNAAWRAYMYYQVTSGPGDLCFGVRGRPAFDKLRSWAEFLNGQSGTGNMQANSAVRGCANFSLLPPVSMPSPALCEIHCQAAGANACEYFQNGDCYAEFGSGCFVQAGYSGWWARVFSSGGGGGSGATTLQGGATLSPEQTAASPNGRFVLKYQSDGNLVLYDNGSPVWAINCWPGCSGTGYAGNSFTPAGYGTMQTDGNFVVYNSSGAPVWHAGTFGNSGAYLSIRDDGGLIVYGPSSNILWQR